MRMYRRLLVMGFISGVAAFGRGQKKQDQYAKKLQEGLEKTIEKNNLQGKQRENPAKQEEDDDSLFEQESGHEGGSLEDNNADPGEAASDSTKGGDEKMDPEAQMRRLKDEMAKIKAESKNVNFSIMAAAACIFAAYYFISKQHQGGPQGQQGGSRPGQAQPHGIGAQQGGQQDGNPRGNLQHRTAFGTQNAGGIRGFGSLHGAGAMNQNSPHEATNSSNSMLERAAPPKNDGGLAGGFGIDNTNANPSGRDNSGTNPSGGDPQSTNEGADAPYDDSQQTSAPSISWFSSFFGGGTASNSTDHAVADAAALREQRLRRFESMQKTTPTPTEGSGIFPGETELPRAEDAMAAYKRQAQMEEARKKAEQTAALAQANGGSAPAFGASSKTQAASQLAVTKQATPPKTVETKPVTPTPAASSAPTTADTKPVTSSAKSAATSTVKGPLKIFVRGSSRLCQAVLKVGAAKKLDSDTPLEFDVTTNVAGFKKELLEHGVVEKLEDPSAVMKQADMEAESGDAKPKKLCLMYRGRILKDNDKLLVDYGFGKIGEDAVMFHYM